MRIFLWCLLLAAAHLAHGLTMSTNARTLPIATRTTVLKRVCASSVVMRSIDRKYVIQVGTKVALGLALAPQFSSVTRANAAAGSDIWTAPLHNRYFLVRSGETTWEADGSSLTTNPVHKLHQERNGLSPNGYDQAKRAAAELKKSGFGANTECWVWTATHASSYQTAEIIADEFLIPYSRIIPEFSFLDQRGYGNLEGTPVDQARKMVWARDAKDPDYRMPANDDGTPSESLRDVQVRVKQALQIMETQYSDLDIAIVGPDSETLSALHCSLEGAPLRLAHQFAFGSGDVRLMDYRNRKENVNLAYSTLDQPMLEPDHQVLRANNILFKYGPEALLHPKP